MLKTESASINGREWTVTQFAGRRSLDVLHDLAMAIGPAMAKAIGGFDRSKAVTDQNMDIGAMVETLILNLSNKDQFTGTINKLLQSTACEGRAITDAEFDIVFAGERIWDLAKVLTFVIRVNYGDFSKAGATIARMVSAQEK
jgi:hypothetical protein